VSRTAATLPRPRSRRAEGSGTGSVWLALLRPIRAWRNRPATSSPRVFPTLDGYRFVGAMAVLICHTGFQTGAALQGRSHRIMARGDIGVAMFFILSGFLLSLRPNRARMKHRERPPVRAYLWRRALRILPAYWVTLVIGAYLVKANRGHLSFADWIVNITLTQCYFPKHFLAGMTHTWSLCAEVSYYLVLSVWMVLPRGGDLAPVDRLRRDLRGCLLLAVSCWVWLWLTHGPVQLFVHHDSTLWWPAHLDWFAAGLAMSSIWAWLSLPAEQRGRLSDPAERRLASFVGLADHPGTCWALGGAIFAFSLSPLAGPYDLHPLTFEQAMVKELCYLFAGVFLLLPGFFGDQGAGAFRRTLASAPFYRLGLISYGIFLLHRPILEWLMPWLGIPLYTGQAVRVTLILIPLSLLAGWLCYRLVEEPATSFRHRWWGRLDPGVDD
jgi:peptidoglycan/LPS O-acetylase OafA/YrhL